jgi:signal transduction histidine kinase
LPEQWSRPTAAAVAGVAALAEGVAASGVQGSFDEVQRQNRELVNALYDLRERQEELVRLTRELEDTNRGVVALYAELDERADHLRRADEAKSRFLSNMSHEFRSPLYSIRALSKLLMDRADGELTDEQAKQVRFIRKAAEELSETVDDLLDIAKIEAGKIELRPVEFEVANLFSALRGMLRPLVPASGIELLFDPCDDIPPVCADEGKVSQILRNFISNALKFTERGEVRVRAQFDAAQQRLTFSVSDTGIGIAPEHQQSVFEEFEQVENRLQTYVKGTGLGLPLCSKLCKLLGGSVGLQSELGKGSTFTATIQAYVPTENTLP